LTVIFDLENYFIKFELFCCVKFTATFTVCALLEFSVFHFYKELCIHVSDEVRKQRLKWYRVVLTFSDT